MILVRAPLRISFVGGGTDLPLFYKQYPGRVISVAINKFVYITINPSAYKLDHFIIKYKKTETVRKPEDLKHDRFKAALLDSGIRKSGLEISSLADLPSGSGLGSSSSFTCALITALRAFQKKPISSKTIAEEACRLEIDILKNNIGKQDQYASAYGGFNTIQFNTNNSVTVQPVPLTNKQLKDFKSNLLLFYTGLSRKAGSVLDHQQNRIKDNLDTYKKMSDSTIEFEKHLLKNNYKELGAMLHHGWLQKKSLSSKISNAAIDNMYETAMNHGAWGGKILGAGGGGCLLIMAKSEKHKILKNILLKNASKNGFPFFREIEFDFVDSGVEVLFNEHGTN